MILTNRSSLPEPIFNLMLNGIRPPQEGVVSVTTLINPPYLNYLRRKHWEELTEDVDERLWALLGSSVAYVLDLSNDSGASEERLTSVVKGIEVTGQFDLLTSSATLIDYKVTSAYSFLLGDKPEWEAQLNMYACLLRWSGRPVEKLQIWAILRDWQKNKAKLDPAYPQIPFMVKDIPLWSPERQETFLKTSVDEYIDPNPRPCTMSERWARPDSWAVKQSGKKTALRVLPSEEEAAKWILESDKKGLAIEYRPGSCVRCENYCAVRAFCDIK